MQILDSHVHFVDSSREEGVDWPPADSPLLRSWMPADFEQANSMHASARCIAVETSRRAADDDWLLHLADSNDRIAGVVLNLQPDETGFEKRLRTALASDKFVGIRLRPIEHYDFSDPLLQQNLALLGNASKTIEFGAKTDALKDQFVHLAQQFDDSTWILDHCGHPADQAPAQTWLDAMRQIAACPNAVTKVTTLPKDPAHARSLLEALLDNFGPERLLYGSNWPVCTLGDPGFSVVDLGTDVFGSNAAAFLSDNARRCYGLASTTRWERIQALFERALELPDGERANFLRSECGDDVELLGEIEKLVAAGDSGDDTLVGAVSSAAAKLSKDTQAVIQDEQIGQYHIVDTVGEGGMGTVYLAERIDPKFQQKVAIKLLNTRRPTASILARFRAERQILANLDHVNIARLLDGGETDDGLPYLVMEYVEGEPIIDYCNRKNLGNVERLQLFHDVCAAVLHAHQNLVIHRDIKPSNILVTEEGVVKLLDFGIAKLLDPEAATQTVAVTMASSRLLTPSYASPEQIRGETLTTSTDVYSLGVLLYQLLTEQLPFEATKDPGDLERAICETEPVRPSTRVSELRTEQNLKQLRGDLDNIVLMAMRKEPARRYATVRQLQADISNYLEERPVIARPETFSYVAGKFVSRNRLAVAAAALFVISIAGLTTFYTWQLTEQRDLAQNEATKATQVARFLRSLFEASDPGEARGETITAAELLHRGAERIDAELADQPEVQATMMNVIGDVHRQLGAYDQAEPLFRRSLAINEELFGAEHASVATSLHNIGMLLRDQGDYAGAEPYLRRAFDMRLGILGQDDPDTLAALTDLAAHLYYRNKYDEAVPLFRQAVAIGTQQLGRKNRQVAGTMTQYGLLLKAMGNYAESEPLLREALAIRLELFGPDHPDVSDGNYNLAQLLELTGKYDESERLYREAMRVDILTLGEKHPYVGYDMTNIARLITRVGRYDEAVALYRQAVALRREIAGPTHPDLATDLSYLAGTLLQMGKLQDAEAAIQESLDIRSELYPDGHRQLADSILQMAQLRLRQGDADRAMGLFEEALAMRRSLLGDKHVEIAETILEIARTHEARGDAESAESSARESVELFLEVFEDSHPDTVRALLYHASLLQQLGRCDDAGIRLGAAREMNELVAIPDEKIAETLRQMSVGACAD